MAGLLDDGPDLVGGGPESIDQEYIRRLFQNAPASIRYNNPGAMWPGPSALAYGSTGSGKIGGGNLIAQFPDPVSGAAAQFDLLNRNYVGMPLNAAIAKWSGGNSSPQYTASVVKATGLSPNAVLTPNLLSDPETAIPLAKAMARQEAGRDYPLSDEQWQAAHSMAVNQPTGSPAGPPVDAADLPTSRNGNSMEDDTIPQNAALAQGLLGNGMGSGLLGQGQGFMGRLTNAFTNPLVMFGLGLASGKTPQEGIGNAASLGFQAQQNQQRQQAQTDTAKALLGMGLSPDMARVAANNPDLLKVLAPELYSKPTWGVIGENPDQTKIYGWIDPRQQTVKAATDSASMEPAMPGLSVSRPPVGTGGTGLGELPQAGREGPPVPSVPMSKAPAPTDMSYSGGSYGPSPLPGGKTDPYLGLKMGLRGQALYDSLPNRLQDGVSAYLDGRVQTGIRTSGEMAYIKRLAQSVDAEGADDTVIAERKKFRTELGSASMQSVGGQLDTGKTALKHLSDVAGLYTELGNESAGAIPMFSQFSNAVHIGTNQDKRSIADAIEAGSEKYAGEAAKYYGGQGGGTGEERGRITSRFSPSLPPDQAAKVLENEKAFLLDKIQTQLSKRDRIFGPLAQRDAKLRDLMDPYTKERVDKIDAAIAKLKAKAAEGRYFFPKQPEGTAPTGAGYKVLKVY